MGAKVKPLFTQEEFQEALKYWKKVAPGNYCILISESRTLARSWGGSSLAWDNKKIALIKEALGELYQRDEEDDVR